MSFIFEWQFHYRSISGTFRLSTYCSALPDTLPMLTQFKSAQLWRVFKRNKELKDSLSPAWTINDKTVIDCCKRSYSFLDPLWSWNERVEWRNFPSNWIPMNRHFLLFCIQHFCAKVDVHKLQQLFSDNFPCAGLFRMN